MFQLNTLRKYLNRSVDEAKWYEYTGTSVPDNEQERRSFANELVKTFTWEEIRLYVHLVDCPEAYIKNIWEGIEPEAIFDFSVLTIPYRLYRYTKYIEEYVGQLLECGLLKLSSPLDFNDPWDCNYDFKVKGLLKNVGISCFSEEDNNVLMYSHYADKHTGICVEFDPYRIGTLRSENSSETIEASWRRVFYYPALPNFDPDIQKAVIATCKNRVWKYEREYRLFAVKNANPQGPGSYHFNRDAITAIFFGCRFDIRRIDKVKKWLADVPNVAYKRVIEPNGSFVITYENC